MKLTSTRKVEPLTITASLELLAEDLEAAFSDQVDPDEILFYAAFSEKWLTAPVSEKLSVLSRIARLAEDAAVANELGLRAGSAEPKEGS